jgi:large subunit ribosomal protein L21
LTYKPQKIKIKERLKGAMTDFAIIKTGGKQYKVREGDQVKVEKLSGEEKKLEFTDLLNDKKVTAEIIGEGKLAKVRILKQEAKKRYKKIIGHRQNYSEIKILKIS